MKLANELLDKQLRGAAGEKIGRVDGIVIVWDAEQPRVLALESGLVTLARRSGFARLLLRLLGPRDRLALRIPWGRVREVDLDVHVSLTKTDTILHRRHDWLQRNILDRIPGGRSHGRQ
jgi:sporulation protein YlmC with PRC-barrel domain